MRGKRSFSAEPCTAAHAEEIAFMRYVATFHFAQNSSSEADGEPTKLRADAPAFVLRAEAPAFVPMSISTHSTPTTVNKFNEPPPMTPLPSPALVPMAMPVMPVAMIGTSPSWWLSPQDMVCAPQPAPDSQASAPSLQKTTPETKAMPLHAPRPRPDETARKRATAAEATTTLAATQERTPPVEATPPKRQCPAAKPWSALAPRRRLFDWAMEDSDDDDEHVASFFCNSRAGETAPKLTEELLGGQNQDKAAKAASEDGAEHASLASHDSSSTTAPPSSEEALSPSSSPSSQTEHTPRCLPSTPSADSPASGLGRGGPAGRHRRQQRKSGDDVNAWEANRGHATRKKSGHNSSTPGHFVWRPKGTSVAAAGAGGAGAASPWQVRGTT